MNSLQKLKKKLNNTVIANPKPSPDWEIGVRDMKKLVFRLITEVEREK